MVSVDLYSFVLRAKLGGWYLNNAERGEVHITVGMTDIVLMLQ